MKRNTKDLFYEMSTDPSFYGAEEEFRAALRAAIKRSTDPLATSQMPMDVRLATLRIRRVRFTIHRAEIERELNDISRLVCGHEIMELKYRIIRAEIWLFWDADFKKAKREFEKLEAVVATAGDNFLYGLIATGLAIANMMLGNVNAAEEYAQDCLSIFRRLGSDIFYANSVNNYALLRKMLCQYSEAEHLYKKALAIYNGIGHETAQILALNNLGVIKLKLGDWDSAEYYLNKAVCLRTCSSRTAELTDSHFLGKEEINLAHLYLMKRDFCAANEIASRFLDSEAQEGAQKLRTLAHEFIGELYIEEHNFVLAEKHVTMAEAAARSVAPSSDVMTEIKRRRAQLHLLQGEIDVGMKEVLDCIRLCIKIGDKHELGAALRILAELRLRQEDSKKAVAAFEASINILKDINECYEQMRSCLAYSEYLVDTKNANADIYLLEAKQLCRKLRIDFFMSQILIVQSKYEFNNGDLMAARASLKTADELCDSLQKCDRNRVKPKIQEWYKTLESAILRSSMESAEKLKAIGKIYEESRFPIEDFKPELALELARNVDAEGLFLAQKKNAGYRIPIRYNISTNDAKHVLRRQVKGDVKELFLTNDPKICPMMNGKTLVTVPGQTGMGYILCTIIEENKTFNPRDLEFLFASVEAVERAAEEYSAPPRTLDVGDFIEEKENWLTHPGGHFKEIITLDQEMIKIIRLAARASQSTVPILLEGETGVGKELFARALHASSPRRAGEFIAINAGGVPLNLLESQLFGHVKGAFTDAVIDRTGLLEEARGGTLFFDEVGEMSEELQVKLLRLLENGEYRRLGENSVRYADVRVVSATNKDLKERVESGLFRDDLYYRLATVRFKIPPLRERKRDIEVLVRHFLNEGMGAIGLVHRRVNVDMKALEAFEIYPWPGNVRELKNEIIRILSLIGGGDLIRFGMLSDRVKNLFESKNDGGVLATRVERFERRLILKALDQNDWNRSKTAEQIGIPRTTLLFKMKQLNIIA